MVRAVSFPVSSSRSELGASSSSAGSIDDGGDGDDLGGLVYSRSERVPETPFSVQLRRYRQWVRVGAGGGVFGCWGVFGVFEVVDVVSGEEREGEREREGLKEQERLCKT